MIGDVKENLANALKENGYNNYHICSDMKESINLLYNKAMLDKDVVITMSPGHASYGLYNNFEERGKDFKEIVNNL